jgi:hypothetical protein
MEGLQKQLQKSLASNTLLEEQLKDQERQNLQKHKEIEDLRKAVAEFEKRRDGFNEVLDHFQKTLLGINGSPYSVVCNNVLRRVCRFVYFRYVATLEQGEVDSATGLCIATDAAKKELDGLLNTGRQACGSLQIAGSAGLSAIGLTKELLLVPGLVADWKQSSAWGGARTALTLAKAHYPELDLDLITSGIPESGEDEAPVDEATIR